MRNSKTWARIRAGEIIRTCNLGHYAPLYVCHAARCGYDCIWLDLEHRAITVREVQALLAYARVYDIDIMVRPPTREATGLYRYLEDGAAGLLVPFVNTAADAAGLVQAVKFPPVGNRGLDNAGFDSDFMATDADTYVAWASRETFLAVQIETPESVKNVEAIAAVPGVDVLFVGPGDLGLRLRQAGEGAMTMDDVWARVAAAARAHGKAFGGPMLTDAERQQRRAQGAQMFVTHGDSMSLRNGLAESSRLYDGLDN